MRLASCTIAVGTYLLIVTSPPASGQATSLTCEHLNDTPESLRELFTSGLAMGYSTAAITARLRATQLDLAFGPIASSPSVDSLRASADMIESLDPNAAFLSEATETAFEALPDSLRQRQLEEFNVRAQGLRLGASYVADALNPEGSEGATVGEVAGHLRRLCRVPSNRNASVQSLLLDAIEEARNQ